ncbi:DUF2255 family protein [Levilactobacillus zymae]|uniref:DUF2255 family protein n=1 Tax=Levilactobacillus zymae TaxID=267363 RepID=UPI003FCE79F6
MTEHATLTWTAAELTQFATADDFRVSPFYSDGHTYGTPTWIWSVVVDGQLVIRAWNGLASRWHRSAVQQGAGRILLAGKNYNVTFAPLEDVTFAPLEDAAVNQQVDAAYRQKYGDSSYLTGMLQAGPRASTLRVSPRS